MSGPIEWGSKKSSGSDKLLEEHPDFAENRLRVKRFVDNFTRDPFPGVSTYLSDNHFYIEAYRGKAKYIAPISLHQDIKEIISQANWALKKCKEYVEYTKQQGDKNE